MTHPNPHELHSRALALRQQGRLAEALAHFDRLLAERPGLIDAQIHRSALLMELARPADALASFDRALALNPSGPLALHVHVGRAMSLASLGRHEEAAAAYDRALVIGPAPPPVILINRGNSLIQLRRYAAALESFQRALAIDPSNAEARNGAGVALRAQSRLHEALENFEAALRTNPEHVVALNNCGLTLRDLRRPRDAIARFEQAVALQPAFSGALANIADVMHGLKRYEESARYIGRVIAVEPDFRNGLGHFFTARQHLCDWSTYDADRQRILDSIAAGKRTCDPLTTLAVTDAPDVQLLCARGAAEDYRGSDPPLWRGERYRHERVRVAYLSADFREHAVAHLLAGIIERHDRTRFEVIALSLRREEPTSAMRARLEGAFEHFYEMSGESDQAVAERIRALEVDIAVDLTGHTDGRRPGILARRPAPVQVNYLGYTGTFGSDYIDYLVADAVAIPHDTDRFYSERIARLPYAYLPCDDQVPITGDPPRRGAAGLPEDGFVFCAFNNAFKLTPVMFDIWMRLLRDTAGSVLWLREAHPLAMENLRKEAARRDVAPERLVFAPQVAAMDQHLARYRLADLFLDTLPYNAHATAQDALWVGLPVLTCLGRGFASRVAGSLLTTLDIPELVTAGLDDYAQRALKLAHTPALLASLREKLAHSRLTSPLFNTDLYCRQLESAYRVMWERSCRGEPPVAFDVPALR